MEGRDKMNELIVPPIEYRRECYGIHRVNFENIAEMPVSTGAVAGEITIKLKEIDIGLIMYILFGGVPARKSMSFKAFKKKVLNG